MSNNIKYTSLALLLFGALYCVLRFAFGIFTPYNYFQAKLDIRNNDIKILRYGLPSFDPVIEQKLAASYGFKVVSVAGCCVTTDLINGVGYYNNVVESHLSKSHGEQWMRKFDAQLDSLIKSVSRGKDANSMQILKISNNWNKEN